VPPCPRASLPWTIVVLLFIRRSKCFGAVLFRTGVRHAHDVTALDVRDVPLDAHLGVICVLLWGCWDSGLSIYLGRKSYSIVGCTVDVSGSVRWSETLAVV
jgi:hypothetical protein